MRTKIAATWIVAHAKGRHALLRDGEVVFEGNKILYVGNSFEGQVDKTIDAWESLWRRGLSTRTCIRVTAPRIG